MTNVTIDGERLWGTLMETAKIGGTAKGGIRRLTMSEEDKRVRDWFKAACEAAGCTVTVDTIGNMFARREGKNPDLPPICMGSHLDTQPTGGKFDGILGVLAGLEAIRSLDAIGYQTNAPIEVINWTNEEGARFTPAMMASGAFAGVFTEEYILSRTDREGTTFADAMDAIGYRGDTPLGGRKLGAMFELHIEQGPILEAEDRMIGVVTGVQSIRWFELTITGAAAHAGATPMPARRDALVGAARAIEAVEAVALAHAPDGVGTVGILECRPGSTNVVPGEVFLTIDLRHPLDEVVARMEEDLRARLAEIQGRLEFGLERIWVSPAVHFDPVLIGHVREAAERLGFRHRDIASGAGHDAVYTARICPTTMVFVPCKEGISHNEAEESTFEQCAAGTQVLLNAVLAYDATLEG
ncbi:N-carbamoyl-L-amino-acid hydrolase [Enterovirga rhinocerotis]|uniref:N-carbamoyl-L-amino-acid hydrolase n=1 Tax=Enterovirga rhinocerotis TaxID=1339210 RepID=A0A4R7BNZ1_9HYPH|nr:N-carbamoyl-L-amino-acid hydrolase [Enterovirga rhinocerotis]